MDSEELEQYLSKLEKKLDKILTMQTKIAKALHLLPVTEKEERAIQIQQRENLNIAAKVNAELDAMSNVTVEEKSLTVDIYNTEESPADIYTDIIGQDILG